MKNLIFILILFQVIIIPQSPDVIFHNAVIITMEDDQPQAEAMAIAGDTILAVGSSLEIVSLAGSSTKIIDLNNLTLLPGFIDSHCHRIGDLWLLDYADRVEPVQDALKLGYTSIHELFVHDLLLNDLVDLDNQDKLRLRVSAYLPMNFDYSYSDWWKSFIPRQRFSPYFRLAGLKITLDREWGEQIFFDQETLDSIVWEGHSSGWQIATHAFAPETITRIINSYENALSGDSNLEYRHRIEHAGIVTDTELNRIDSLNLIPSVQFNGTPYMPDDSSFQIYIPDSMRQFMVRTRDMLDAGIKVTGNTDAPWGTTDWRNRIRPPHKGSPLFAVYAAATRKGFWGRVPEPWQTAQTISVAEALKLLTINGAYAAFEDGIKGSIKPGKLADLVILTGNPLITPVDEIPSIKNILTMVGGKAEYCYAGYEYISSYFEENISLNKPVFASSSLSSNPPEFAVDGNPDTYWGSGEHPVQWIEVDLQNPSSIQEVQLVIDQFPDGETEHIIWGKTSEAEPYGMLHTFTDYTRSGDVQVIRPPEPWEDIRFIKVETVQSPSWVAWKEIKITSDRIITELINEPEIQPVRYGLQQNYPNPFNPVTRISYSIEERDFVSLKIFDMLGQETAILVNEEKVAGNYEIAFNGSGLSSGLYICKLQSGNYSETMKMVLLK